MDKYKYIILYVMHCRDVLQAETLVQSNFVICCLTSFIS